MFQESSNVVAEVHAEAALRQLQVKALLAQRCGDGGDLAIREGARQQRLQAFVGGEDQPADPRAGLVEHCCIKNLVADTLLRPDQQRAFGFVPIP